MKEVARELTKRTGKVYSPPNLSLRLKRGQVRYHEVKEIASILGREVRWCYPEYNNCPAIEKKEQGLYDR